MSKLADLNAAAEKVTLDHAFAVESHGDEAIGVSVQFRCQRDAVDVPSIAGFDAAFKMWWNALPGLLAERDKLAAECAALRTALDRLLSAACVNCEKIGGPGEARQ